MAEKYGGAMSIETQENVFVLHVLLIIPQHPESSTQQMDKNVTFYHRKKKKEAVCGGERLQDSGERLQSSPKAAIGKLLDNIKLKEEHVYGNADSRIL